MKVYQALYNSNTEESSYGTLSIHKSKEGAERAISLHRESELEEWKKLYPTKESEPFDFDDFQAWCVREVDVLP